MVEKAMDSTVLSDAQIQNIRSSLRGQLITPRDEGYEQARKVHNAMIDRYPRLIIQPANAGDVVKAVNVAHNLRLELSVRGGGHNPNGFGTNDAGLVIDLSSMRGVRVDPVRRRVRVEGGATLGDVDHATHAFGLVTPGGIISTTGVSGLTLGGGLGHLTRKFGLSIDNLVSADVITADGNFLTTSQEENEDLFWALRGGGGNFGVVTSLEFKLHPLSTVIAGPILYLLEKAKEALQMYRDFMDAAPDDVNAFFAFLKVPPAPPFPETLYNQIVCGVVACYAGKADQAEDVLKPLRQFGPPLVDGVGPLPFPALQSAFDPLVAAGQLNYWKADFLNEISDAAIDAFVRFGSQVPTINTAIHIYPVSGAANRIGKDETAWSYRSAKYSPVFATLWADPNDNEKNIQWTRDFWSAVHPHSTGGAYVNFMMDEPEGRVQASYRENYDRLADIKRKYDPDNLFHHNQNIRPAS